MPAHKLRPGCRGLSCRWTYSRKRAAFRGIQCRAGETDHLVKAVNAIRTAVGLLCQRPEIDPRSVTKQSGMPDGRSSSVRGKERRVANYHAGTVNYQSHG